MQSFPVGANLFLVRHVIETNVPLKSAEAPIHHVMAVDCSGSMSGDLPQIRNQLKKKLPHLLRETDIMSIIWFSGENQCGVLVEAEPVAILPDITRINEIIDRWLRPVGLTSFLDPIEAASALVARTLKSHPGHVTSFTFMSDGCDNCSRSQADILKAVEKAAGGLATTTIVEYGYYADRPFLTAMAEKAGGSFIFAESFDKYEPVVEAALQKRVLGGKRIEITVPGDVLGGFVWEQTRTGDLITYAVSGDGTRGGKVSVPETTTEIWYLSSTPVGTTVEDLSTVAARTVKRSAMSQNDPVSAAYAAISLFSTRAKPNVVLPLLGALGDKALLERFGGLFGKQKYSDFMAETKSAAFDPQLRYVKGYDPKALPCDDAFTVLDMLRLLASDKDNVVLLDHAEFRYNRISRARVDASSVLTADEQAEITQLTTEMAKTKNAKKVKELTDRIAAITAAKPEPLTFVADPCPNGISISNLTYNERNPNISILVRREGSVNISKHVPEALRSVLPEKFPTFIWRNYAIVKDGLVNVATLPVRLSAKTLTTLFAEAKAGRIPGDVITSGADNVLLNFATLPIINRQMVKAVSARSLFESEWALIKVQSAEKVYSTTLKDLAGSKKSASFEVQYGAEAAEWLKNAGFTDYSGFSPKSVQADARDFYMARELKVAIKSFSSIPSLNEFKKQADKGKFTPSAALMETAAKDVIAYLDSDDYKNTPAAGRQAAFETWLKSKIEPLDRDRRKLLADKAQQIFSVIVGQTWFTEFASIDENTMDITLDGQKLACRVEMNEVKVEL